MAKPTMIEAISCAKQKAASNVYDGHSMKKNLWVRVTKMSA